jgi:DNA-binding transcriptional LysR family regulator
MPQSGYNATSDVRLVGLSQPQIDRRIALVWNPAALSPTARAFLALAEAKLRPGKAPAGP